MSGVRSSFPQESREQHFPQRDQHVLKPEGSRECGRSRKLEPSEGGQSNREIPHRAPGAKCRALKLLLTPVPPQASSHSLLGVMRAPCLLQG